MSAGEDTYTVLDGSAVATIKVKGSRFVAEALPVNSVQEAESFLAGIRKREYDATHHCSAWRIGPNGQELRYSDDGEPNSTAGLPIFRHIEGKGLTNTMVVVTRYYGGTKLGTGGLIRAYGDAAAEALDAAPWREVIPRTSVFFRFSYEDTSPAMHTIGQFDAIIAATNYSEDTVIDVHVRSSQVDSFCATASEALSGRGELTVQEPM